MYRKLSWQHPKTKKIVQVQLHRIVWARFKGIPKDGQIVNHVDGDKQNCALLNLELTSDIGNVNHAIDSGLVFIPKGDDRPNAKFADADVRKYRRLFALGRVRRTDIAKEVGASIGVVSGMLRGRTYSHVTTKYDSKCIEMCTSRR